MYAVRAAPDRAARRRAWSGSGRFSHIRGGNVLTDRMAMAIEETHVRSRIFRSGTLVFLGLLVAMAGWVLGRGEPSAVAEPVQIARATAKATPAPSAWQTGIAHLRKGRFEQALSEFQKDATGPSKSPQAQKAVSLVTAHMAVLARAETPVEGPEEAEPAGAEAAGEG